MQEIYITIHKIFSEHAVGYLVGEKHMYFFKKNQEPRQELHN
jgi:hypothetical protein